jgi:tRNA dimethylallyltransferase
MKTAPRKVPRAVIIAGPTGIGKTKTAIDLARRFGAEIVNADSMQVYRFMDIGTAKPGAGELAAVPHHLIDIVDPDQPFDAARYGDVALRCVESLAGRGVPALVTGGTGLYIRALVHGLFPARKPAPAVRDRLQAEMEAAGPVSLHRRLCRLDPASGSRIQPRDAYRIRRALEVLETTGRPLSAHFADHGFAEVRVATLQIVLEMDRKTLYERINRRAAAMIQEGLLEETAGLISRGYGPRLKPMRALGYRHAVACLRGENSREEMLRLLQRDTRRYAKRQMTWFRREPAMIPCAAADIDGMEKRIAAFLSAPGAGPRAEV